MPFFDESRLRKVRVGIDSYTNTEFVLDVIGYTNVEGKSGIGSVPTDDSPELFVDGDGYFTGVVTATTFFAGPTEITGGAAADNLQVEQISVQGLSTFTGISTFQDDVFIDGDLGITGDIIFDDLIIGRTQDNILGDVETGALQIEGGLGVAKNVSIGSSLFVNTQIGIGSTVPTAELDVVGQTELDDVNVAGIATINELSLNDLNVTGLSTFGDNVDINASVDISNDLVVKDALNVTGLSTFGDNVDINASVDISQTLNVTGVATFGNNVEITGDLTVNGNQTILNTQTLEVEDINIGIASADPKLSDAALDGAGITIHGAAGDKTLTWSNANSRMEFNTDLYAPAIETDLLDVTGVSTFGGNVDINASVDISNDLVVNDALNVTGLSTFGSDVDINGSVDISNDLVVNDDLSVTGLSTFSSTVDINANLDVDGRTQLDVTDISETLNVLGLSTFSSNVDINANLDVDGDAVITGILTVGTTSPIVIDGDINSITVGTGASIHNPLDNVLTLGTNNEERVRLDQDGNLGIGTTNPSGAADVNNVTVLNAGIVTANFFYGSGAGLFDIFADAKGDDGAVQYNNATNIDGAADFFYDDTNFRVGIGSTVPAEKLDVIGNVAVAGTITATEFVGIGSQLTDITLGQLSDVDVSNLVALGAGTTTPDYLMIYDPVINSFRFVDPKTYFGINNDFNPAPSIVDYGTY